MSNKLSTWMWATDNGVHGLDFDPQENILRWYDSIGCACGDTTAQQTPTQYRQKGIPGGILFVPDDILAELDALLPAPNTTP
ncbi:MAG TPA: hypothetical protein VLL52_03030 [Anaerolineae bacterium]|nr:hypothetical protein [Anaerolineae bacterium]